MHEKISLDSPTDAVSLALLCGSHITAPAPHKGIASHPTVSTVIL